MYCAQCQRENPAELTGSISHNITVDPIFIHRTYRIQFLESHLHGTPLLLHIGRVTNCIIIIIIIIIIQLTYMQSQPIALIDVLFHYTTDRQNITSGNLQAKTTVQGYGV